MNKRFNQVKESKTDLRLKIAKLILQAPERGSLEYISELNTSYLKWIEDYNITKEWIGDFPTYEIYNNYVRYCLENRFINMDRRLFFKTLARDFNIRPNRSA